MIAAEVLHTRVETTAGRLLACQAAVCWCSCSVLCAVASAKLCCRCCTLLVCMCITWPQPSTPLAHSPRLPQAKHRARFWALADAFLASGMVPAYTAAAFVKRLARLALAAPPAGALLALGFIHNIVRRHPATMQLLHRPPRGGLAAVGAAAAAGAPAPAAPAPQPLLPLPPQVAGGQPAAAAEQQQADAAEGAPAAANGTANAGAPQQQKALGPAWQGEDVFDYAEPDPAASRALESSLWELEALRCHHSPQVGAPWGIGKLCASAWCREGVAVAMPRDLGQAPGELLASPLAACRGSALQAACDPCSA